jgi:hypothetical protein
MGEMSVKSSSSNGRFNDNAIGLRSNVVIVGGGPAGVAALNLLVSNDNVASVTILDPIAPGFGNVFGELCAADPALLCNSIAGLTWMEHDRPDGFVQFLADRGWPIGREVHTPRYLFGEYARHIYLRALRRAEAAGKPVRHLAERARSITKVGHGYVVELESGANIQASHVLLCVGLERPKVPSILAGQEDNGRLILSAYPASRLRQLPKASHVLVIGLRSSGQDAMMTLVRSGHSVVMTSPSGRLSSVRGEIRDPGKTFFDRDEVLALDSTDPRLMEKVKRIVMDAIIAAGGDISPESQISEKSDTQDRLREEIGIAEAGRARWADLNYDFVNTLNELLGGWDVTVRKRIMSETYGVLTRFVNSLPLAYGKRLLNALDEGNAEISAEFPEKISADDNGWLVSWPGGRKERFDFIVSGGGYHFPRFLLESENVIRIGNEGDIATGVRVADIGQDLRLRFCPGSEPENIWALGASTNQRFPFAHLMWLSVKHAQNVASEFDGGAGASHRLNQDLHGVGDIEGSLRQ